MRGIHKLVKYIFTTFCKIFIRILHTYSKLCIKCFTFGNSAMHLGYLKILGEASLWGSGVFNKNSN